MTSESLASHPQITPLLKLNGIHPERLIEVLRCDGEPESAAVARKWDSLTPADRALAGVEVIALSCSVTPRRLWEVFSGAALVQAKESVGVQLAEALPEILRIAIIGAKKAKGQADREHVFKAARILPVPKGSTTVINMPGNQQGELESPEEDDGRALASADDILMRASRAIHAKPVAALPASTEIVDAEVVEPEDDEEDEE